MTAGLRRPAAHDARATLLNYLGWLEQQLGDGRRYVLGADPCIADVSIAQTIWFMQLSPKVAQRRWRRIPLGSWYGRVAAFGHRQPSELSSSAALQVSAQATAHACAVDATLGFEAGAQVTVNALTRRRPGGAAWSG